MNAVRESSGDGVEGGVRTRARAAIIEVLDQLDGFRSAQELWRLMKEHGRSVGLSTVYRSLQALVEDREVNVVWGAGSRSALPPLRAGVALPPRCRHCGQAHEIADVGLERWATQLSERYRFVEVDPAIEIRGTCLDCSAGQA